MKKPILKIVCFALLIIACLLALSSCSFSDLMSKGTGISNDPDYQTWEKLTGSGKLDSEGKYTANAVHVTFASNNFLDVRYYRDTQLSDEIEGSAYLFPGDLIYASINQKESSKGVYLFDHLDVIEYNAENKRGGKLDWKYGNSGVCLMIPFDYQGTEVSVEPVGQFGSRSLLLKAYLSDEKTPVNGTWSIDDKVYPSGTVSVNPFKNYNIAYHYNPEKYYFLSSRPVCWREDDSLGLVVFETAGAATGEEWFEVILDSYISAGISVRDGELLGIDSEYHPVETNNKNWNITKLKEDSIFNVYLSSKKENNLECSLEAKISKPEAATYDGKACYVCTVELGNESSFIFIPSEYLTEHGKLRFIYNGQEINEKNRLNSGNAITVEAGETEEGYWLPDNGRQVTIVGKETSSILKKICFYPKELVTVILDKPTAGGIITYYANGQELTGSSAKLLCGTRITAIAQADKGWESQIDSEDDYIVSELNNQVVTLSGKTANEFFRQMDSYKPMLKIRTDGNLGNKCKINVSANGYNGTDSQIGTDEDIHVSFSSMDFGSNDNAVMLNVEKKLADGKTYKEIYYATKANEPVVIPFANGLQYKEITIDAKAIQGEYFLPYQFENADIDVRFNDITPDGSIEEGALTSDTFIHDNRKLTVTVTPKLGYTMVGADTTYEGSNSNAKLYIRNDITYKDFKSQISKVEQEQIKKICILTLDTNDEHGIVEYRIDGQVYTGKVAIIEGGKLFISYRLTDDQYEIEYNDSDFIRDVLGWTGVANNANSGTKEVTITADMDGLTITRDLFITVRQKGVN